LFKYVLHFVINRLLGWTRTWCVRLSEVKVPSSVNVNVSRRPIAHNRKQPLMRCIRKYTVCGKKESLKCF